MKPIIVDKIDTLYLISEKGIVYNTVTKKYLRGNIRGDGYHRVKLHFADKAIAYYVHRLVALAYIPNINEYEQINHIDNNRSNNCVSNLEWTTQQLNIKHKIDQDRQAKGLKHGQCKLSENDVLEIRQKYSSGEVSQRFLAAKYSVDQGLIWRIIHRKIWKHI